MSAPEVPTLPDLNSGPRNFITTGRDHGGIALTICTLMATWDVLCFLIRIFMRATVSGPFGLDDIVCGVATVFGVIQMLVASAAVSFGFGKALELLTDAQIAKASQAVYAAQLLYIVTNALAKCTVALLLARIVFIRNRVYACHGILGLSVLWGVASFVTEAVRCTKEAPWKIVGSHCASKYTMWQVITAFNILIEILIFAMPIWLVWGLQTNLTRKFTVVAVFSLRTPVIVAAGLRLHFLHQTIGSSEPLFKAVIPFICLNVEMHYALMAATIPTLKPFVGAFNTGWGTYDTQGVSGYGGNSSGHSYAMRSVGKNSSKSDRGGFQDSAPMSAGQNSDLSKPARYPKNITLVRSGKADPTRLSDDSRQMIIWQDRTTEVHVEAEPRSDRNWSAGAESIDLVKRPPYPQDR